MLTLDELLELLARTDELTADEQASLNEALANLSAWTGDGDLAAIEAALVARANGILDATISAEPQVAPTDEQLAELDFIGQITEAVTAEQAERDGADDAAISRAQELAERIRGQAGDGDGGEDGDATGGEDGDDGDATEGEGGDDAGTDGADEGADAEAVAAAATRVSRVNARRPRTAAPRAREQAGQQVALTASANVPNAAMGARLDTPQRLGLAFADTLEAMGNMSLRPGMRVPIASARIEFPEGAALSMTDARYNEQLIEQYAGVAAVTASGTICAPPVPRWELPQVAIAERPVRDGLTRFGAERGGVLIPAPLRLDDVDGSSTVWTAAQNASAAQNPSVRKPCLRLECGDDTTVLPYAIVQCLEIDNWNARTWPERIARFVALAEAYQARLADSRLLTRIGSLSTQVTVPQNLGTTRDVLRALDRAGAGMRNSHRMSPSTPLRWMAPATLRDEMRADLAAEMPGSTDERLAASDAYIDSFFAARHINVSWFIDGEAGQVFPVQSDGVLRGWHPNIVSYLFPEGTFILLDGGELNLGVVRDSELNSRNDHQMFREFWEEVAMVGIVSYRLTMALCPDGSSAGTVEPTCSDLASS